MKTLFLILLFLYPHVFLAAQSWKADLEKADSLMQKRNFKNALIVYEQILPKIEKDSTQMSPVYLSAGNSLGRCMTFASKREVAEVFLLTQYDLCKKFGTETQEYAAILHHLGTFYSENLFGLNIQKSETYYQQAVALRKKILGEKHRDYANSLNNLANLYADLGDYSKAETLYIQALNCYKEALGEKNHHYASSLNNLAVLYRELGNFSKSEALYLQAAAIYKESLGEKHPNYASSLNNLALVYKDLNNYAKADSLYTKAAIIYKEALGEKHLNHANALNNSGLLHRNLGNYSKAESLYLQALSIKKEVLGEKQLGYASSLTNLARLYTDLGNYSKAESLYLQALTIKKEILGHKHQEYVISAINLAFLYQTQNQGSLALSYYLKSINSSKELIAQNFPILSEKEKTDYYSNQIVRYFSYFYSFAVPNNLSAEMYDLQLLSKGILLNATQKMKSRILNSKDSTLISEYQSWNSLKLSLVKYNQMPKEILNSKMIDLDSLENLVSKKEKLLSRSSESFAQLSEKPTLTWQDIQKTLKKGEAAIEIVRLSKFGLQKIVTDTSDVAKAPKFPKYYRYDLTDDTTYYAALIVKKSSKQPEMVLIKNGNELEEKFVVYQKNTIQFMQEDLISYDQFWRPIAQKLKGIKKVYFSPDGVYNQISLNTLQNPKTKKFVLDEIELHLVTNTKDILAFGKSENKTLKAELLGYPLYDLQTQNADAARMREVLADSTRAFANFQQVSLLPGTKKEVEDIFQILSQKKYSLEILTEQNATEENIKKVKNPKILHLSTHGFFIDSKEKNEKVNPMLRSGLLLTGVSDYTRAEVKPDTEDGILTALEAANLDLDETDLVVLSACETGLGDVKAGEGVYGLQRAFKVAGAKSIVMSMWKVDDAVTQKLMTTFYQKFAESNNARQAFKEAQAIIKKQHPKPYYWGAFVMVGE